jgi:tetratricopeptide (TPR) repeat protein
LFSSNAGAQPAPVGQTPATTATAPDPDSLFLSDIQTNITDAQKQIQRKADAPTDQGVQADANRKIAEDIRSVETTGNNNPTNAKVNLAGGAGLVGISEPQRAMPLLDRAVDVSASKGDNKTLGQALFTRAAANVALRDYGAITRDAKRILSFDPNNQQAQMLVSLYAGRVASSGAPPKPPEQVQPENGMIENSGGQARVLEPNAMLARAALTAGQIEAARYVKQAADKFGLGDKAGAKQLLDKALTTDPKNVPALLARAKNAKATGDASGELADADAVTKIDATKAEAYFLRGDAKKALNYPANDYAADYAKASELDPSFSSAEMAALAGASNASSTSGTSDLAQTGAAARARGASLSKLGPLNQALEGVPPQYRLPVAAGAGLLFIGLLAWLALALLRRVA